MSMAPVETLGIAYDAIKALIEKRMKATVSVALKELRANTMTPERAIHLWMEMNANAGLLRSVETTIKVKTTEEVDG